MVNPSPSLLVRFYVRANMFSHELLIHLRYGFSDSTVTERAQLEKKILLLLTKRTVMDKIHFKIISATDAMNLRPSSLGYEIHP
jgi:hypothetical protein